MYGVNRGAQVTGIAVMALSLTWISACLRLYVRTRLLKFIGREDWLMLASMICLTLLCSLFLAALIYGLGAHMRYIPVTDKTSGFKIIFICELLYVVTTAVTKLSIGVYFFRLSSKKYQNWIINITLAIVMLVSTMYFFFLLFQCSPINFLWNQWNNDTGTCLHSPILANVTYAHAVMSALTDWSFGILPIFFVRKMRMDLRTRLSVVLILSLGFFASTATIVRIIYIKSLTETDDYSWEGINLVKWSMVEPAIAITASNIATLRPLFKNFAVFATRRFDNRMVDDEDRVLNGSKERLSQSERCPTPKLYSAEFADMLGLSKAGVTTEITSGGRKESIANTFGLQVARRMSRRRGQTNLDSVTSTTPTAPDWSQIEATTVITFDKR